MSPLRGSPTGRFRYPALTRWATHMSPLRGFQRYQNPVDNAAKPQATETDNARKRSHFKYPVISIAIIAIPSA